MKKILPAISVLTAAFLVLIFLNLVHETAVNLPIWDDFDSAFFFVNRILETPFWADRAILILEQHNEHRILINRLLTLLSLALFSSINFLFLIYCAIAALVTLALTLPAKTENRWLGLVISTAILLQPQYGDGLNWVTTCLASFSLCLFAFTCSHLVFGSRTQFFFAILLMALACFSQGNGILLPLCLIIVLLMHRRWARAAGIAASGAAIIGCYFIGFKFPPRSNTLEMLISRYPEVLEYGFTLVGNAAGFSDPAASLTSGVVLTLLFFGLMCTAKTRAHPALISLTLFLFFSAGINTLARGLSGSQWALSPGRYTILGAGILATLSLMLLENIRLRSLKAALVAAALAFNYCSWQFYRSSVEELQTTAINDVAKHLLRGDGLTYPWPERGIPIFDKALTNNIFNLEAVITDLRLHQRVNAPLLPAVVAKKDLRSRFDRIQAGPAYLVIEGWGFLKGCLSSETETVITLNHPEDQVVVAPRPKFRGDVADLFKKQDRGRSGFITMIPKRFLKEQLSYEVNAVFICGGRMARMATPYRVSTAGVDKTQPADSPQEPRPASEN